MIRKRQPENKPEPVVEKTKPKKQQAGPSKNPINKEFKTYHEEACYVLNLLESQGIDIYEEGRFGGMYLNRHSGGKVKHIFENTNMVKSKKSNQQPIIDNTESTTNNIDFASIFGSK